MSNRHCCLVTSKMKYQTDTAVCWLAKWNVKQTLLTADCWLAKWNKHETMVHLVGFTIETYYDARPDDVKRSKTSQCRVYVKIRSEVLKFYCLRFCVMGLIDSFFWPIFFPADTPKIRNSVCLIHLCTSRKTFSELLLCKYLQNIS